MGNDFIPVGSKVKTQWSDEIATVTRVRSEKDRDDGTVYFCRLDFGKSVKFLGFEMNGKERRRESLTLI